MRKKLIIKDTGSNLNLEMIVNKKKIDLMNVESYELIRTNDEKIILTLNRIYSKEIFEVNECDISLKIGNENITKPIDVIKNEVKILLKKED